MKISAEKWQEVWLRPLLAYQSGLEMDTPMAEEIESGLAGFTLDGILAVKDIDGQDANDWECVEMVHQLIEAARLTSLKIERAEG